MKTRSIIYSTLCSLMLGMGFASCSDDINGNEKPIIDPVDYPAYILNEGKWGSNNANISRFFPNYKITSAESDFYQQINGKQMGDNGKAMIKDNNNLYVSISGSKYVARLNKYTQEQARYSFPENEGVPRYMDVEGNYIYVTQYGGQVSKINIKDMSLAGTFHKGDNLEGIVEKDGKLYVANTYKGNYDYNQEVFVVDAKTMTLEKTIQVVLNPEMMYEIDDKIYLISNGNYANVPGALQVFDTEKGTFIPILNDVTKIAEGNDGLVYGVCSTYDANWQLTNSFFTYNPKTNAVSQESFLQDAPASFSTDAIYLLEVDDNNGYIYVGTSDYVNTGTIYQFDKNGKFIQSFDSGGVNPRVIVFMD